MTSTSTPFKPRVKPHVTPTEWKPSCLDGGIDDIEGWAQALHDWDATPYGNVTEEIPDGVIFS